MVVTYGVGIGYKRNDSKWALDRVLHPVVSCLRDYKIETWYDEKGRKVGRKIWL